LGIILIAVGIGSVVDGAGDGVTTQNYNYVTGQWEEEGGPDESKISGGTTAIVFGSIFLLGNAVFNIVRSATYNKPVPTVAEGFDPTGLQFALLPGNRVSLSYTMRF
jgi:hypothetical protein